MSEQSQQVDLDLDLEGAEEAVVDLDETAQPEGAPVVEEIAQEDNYEKAENATQKRINRLTKKMRESERQQEAAITYAQQVQQENVKLNKLGLKN